MIHLPKAVPKCKLVPVLVELSTEEDDADDSEDVSEKKQEHCDKHHFLQHRHIESEGLGCF